MVNATKGAAMGVYVSLACAIMLSNFLYGEKFNIRSPIFFISKKLYLIVNFHVHGKNIHLVCII